MIAVEIERDGPITFRRFMELALYEPRVGYYAGKGAGPGPLGDYLTSPELHAAFGALICAQLDELWRLLGEPSPFWVIEGGPGTGRLAADLLAIADSAFPSFAEHLALALIERNPVLEQRQQKLLAPWSARIRWLEAAPDAWTQLGDGCVLANELLDNFPVHRLAGSSDGIRERFVRIDGDRFVEVEGSVSSLAVLEQLEAGGGRLPLDCLGEVSLEGPTWVAASSRLLGRGYIQIIDYGEVATRLYGRDHSPGTLRGYRDHVLVTDLLALPGLQDITAHVDLSAVRRAAEQAGMQLIGSTRQGEFLDRLGLPSLIERVESRIDGRPAQRAHRAALELLRDPAGFGNLAILLFGKDAPSEVPAGFGGHSVLEVTDVAPVWRLSEPD